MNVDPPQFGIQSEGFKRSFATELFDLIDVDGAAVIARSRISLGVFVVETRAEGDESGATAKVLRSDQFQTANLTPFFLF